MDEQQRPPSEGPTLRQRGSVALAIALAVAVVGFFVGIHAPAPPEIMPRYNEPKTTKGVAKSRPYLSLVDRPRAQSSHLAALRKGLPADGKLYPRPTAAQRKAALEQRASRRAYDGAPPTIPHAMDERGVTSCLSCHERGIVVAGKRAPKMSHDARSNCTQCHVSALRRGPPSFLVDNGFRGAATTGRGAMAWSGAPPLMSHGPWMREQCSSCHGAAAHPGLRTPHPGRRNCRQCHVVAGSEFPR